MSDRLFQTLCSIVLDPYSSPNFDGVTIDRPLAIALAGKAYEEKVVPQLLGVLGEILPPEVRTASRSILQRQAAWSERLCGSLPREAIVVKGPTYEWADPRNIGARQFNDLDLFIPSLDQTEEVLLALHRAELVRLPIAGVRFGNAGKRPLCISLRFMPMEHLPGFSGAEVQIGGFPIDEIQFFDGSWLMKNTEPWNCGTSNLKRVNDLALFCIELSTFMYGRKPVRLRHLLDIRDLAARISYDEEKELGYIVTKHGMAIAADKVLKTFERAKQDAPELLKRLSMRYRRKEIFNYPPKNDALIVRSSLDTRMTLWCSNRIRSLRFVGQRAHNRVRLRRVVRYILSRRPLIRFFRHLGVSMQHHAARHEGIPYELEIAAGVRISGCLTIVLIDPPA